MNKTYIELLKNIRDDSYKLGHTDGVKVGRNELVKQYEMLQNELCVSQKRAAWLQNKLTRTKENYEGQINNLQNMKAHCATIIKGVQKCQNQKQQNRNHTQG